MSFAIFDENFYLKSYPDVAAAVSAGIFNSGLQHFQQAGLQEGRTEVSPFYKEEYYISLSFGKIRNPDVFNAKIDRNIPSALAHFINSGEAEGRVPESSFYNERYYLQHNPDVANAVASGSLPSGFAHFIRFGIAENRRGGVFNEKVYRANNPDVAAGVSAGLFSSVIEHYARFGEREGRAVFLSGTNGNDFVSGVDTFSPSTRISGVGIDVLDVVTGQPGQNAEIIPTSLGVGEVDILTGSYGRDTFILGLGRSAGNPDPQKFYVGGGDADFAEISDIDRVDDVIIPGLDSFLLAGSPNEYVFDNTQPGTVRIYAIANGTTAGQSPNLDLVAVVRAFSLSVANVDPVAETFTLNTSVINPPITVTAPPVGCGCGSIQS